MQRTPFSDDSENQNQISVPAANSLRLDQIKTVRRRYYEENITQIQLARDYDTTRRTISRIVNYDVYPDIATQYKVEKPSQFKVQLARHYGLKINQLADLFGCSERTIYRYLA